MTRSRFPVRLTLKGLEDDSTRYGIIRKAHYEYTFRNLKRGEYQAFGKFADGSEGETDKVRLSRRGSITVYVVGSDLTGNRAPAGPPFKRLASAATGISVLTSPVSLSPAVQSRLPAFLRVSARLSVNTPPVAISPFVKERLRGCIVSNIDGRIRDEIGIPAFSDFVQDVLEDNLSDSELVYGLLRWYQDIGRLRATIDDCDPSLILELRAASRISEEREQIVVTGQVVNIRASGSLDAVVLTQVEIGQELRVDSSTFASLSINQKEAIQQGNGWLPIFLPSSDEQGYIYSQYTRPQ